MDDDLDSIIGILNDNDEGVNNKFQSASNGGIILERPSK